VQTIKTAVVVVLLLVVLYGAYVAINGSDTELPAELQNMLANDSEMDIDVSMPSFDSAGLTPGSGLKPMTPFGSNASDGKIPDFNSKPNPFFNNKTGTPPPAVDTLLPPKLTNIPGTESSTVPGNFPSPTASEEPSFSLNLDGSGKSGDFKNNSASMLSPPTATKSEFKPLTPIDLMSIPGTVASQTTVSSEAIKPLPANNPALLTSSTSKDLLSNASDKKANITGRSFENAKKVSIEQVDRGEFKEALATMSVFYNSPELSAEQSIDLINLLDTLAGETIYSRRHLLDTPYVVGPGETIDDIAKRFEIPTELLVKINAVDTTMGLLPGQKLKVFQGPFRAEVDVNRHEMTVFLGDLYAGRFPVSTGADPQPKEGVFQVLDKQRHRNYYGKGGVQIDGKDPRNPYGGWWMDLGQDLSIHGSPDNPASDGSSMGCISLSPLDAGDVFSMLTRGSQVTIKR